MKNWNYYRILQWVVFSPILVPLCIIMGALEGIQHTFEKVIKQIKTDVTDVVS